MKKPEMIIFDYGHTHLYEPDWNSVRGNSELLKYATKNPNNCTLDDIIKGAELIFGQNIENVRKIGYDISGQIGNKALYEYLGIEFSLTPTIINLDVKSMTSQPWFTRTCYISYNEISDWTNDSPLGTPRPCERQLSMLSLWHSFLQVEPTSVRSHHSVDRIGNE